MSYLYRPTPIQDSGIMVEEVAERTEELRNAKHSREMLNSGYCGSVGYMNSQQLWLTAQTCTRLSQSNRREHPHHTHASEEHSVACQLFSIITHGLGMVPQSCTVGSTNWIQDY